MSPLLLFYSYSHRDEHYRDELAKHLKLLERAGILTSWHDRRISAGDEWRGQIDENLKKADLILLLISPDFIASDYCYDVELRYAMQRHRKGKARVIPIIIRDVNWHDAPFGVLQALPVDGKPVSAWDNIDTAWANVEKGIRAVINEITQNGGTRKPLVSEALRGDKTNDFPDYEQQTLSQGRAGTLTATKSREIELTIDVDFDTYTDQDKELLLNAIANLLKITDSELKIKKIRRGSIKITLEMHSDLAMRLYQAIKAGELKQLGVTKAELKGQEALRDVRNYPEFLDRGSIDELFSKTYSELERIATKILRGAKADDPIDPTALVHETYIILSESQAIPQERVSFFAFASRIMRQILLDYARSHGRLKRGGSTLRVELAEITALTATGKTEEMLALDEALKRLEAMDSRLSRIVELRLFGGLSTEEIAKVLNMSPNTVKYHWKSAKAWLMRELSS